MKKFLSVTLALLILFNLTSCYRPNTIFRTERSDLYAVTCFSVPYIAGNPEWDKVFIMEQDSQGRTLYKYIANTKFLSDYSDDFVYAMVICQKSDENFAYYYDDFNFILSEDGEFGEEEITKLKNWNDWSQNLDYSKMAKVQNNYHPHKTSYSYSETDFLNYNEDDILKAWEPYFNDVNLSYRIDLVSKDAKDRYLFAIRELGDDGYKNSYFVICNSNFEIESPKGIQEINDIFNCQETSAVCARIHHAQDDCRRFSRVCRRMLRIDFGRQQDRFFGKPDVGQLVGMICMAAGLYWIGKRSDAPAVKGTMNQV